MRRNGRRCSKAGTDSKREMELAYINSYTLVADGVELQNRDGAFGVNAGWQVLRLDSLRPAGEHEQPGARAERIGHRLQGEDRRGRNADTRERGISFCSSNPPFPGRPERVARFCKPSAHKREDSAFPSRRSV